MDLKIGTVIGNYQIREQLGQGTSSTVYLAQHTVLTNRTVAIKFLRTIIEKNQQEQFIKEADILEQLKHPHILSLYDIGMLDKHMYLITEYAPGGSLREKIRRLAPQRLSFEEALAILLQVSQGLEYAHRQNIVHRDVKPGNILFSRSNQALLADFGVAIMLRPEQSTLSTQVVGTPAYMAPEQWDGDVSTAVDQYALGCVAYELFTGRHPFMADNVLEVLRQQKQETPVPLRHFAPELSPQLERVVLMSLAKERGQRFANIADFAAALESAAKGSSRGSLLSSTFKFAREKLTKNAPASTILFPSSREAEQDLKDFFVAYHKADRFWAEWIAWQLEDAGYTTILPAWDFQVGTNFNAEMRKAAAKAKYSIIILSPDYFAIRENVEEWNTIFRQSIAHKQEKLIPVLVRQCEQTHLNYLHSIVPIDLLECDEMTAMYRLLAGVRHERIKPSLPPPFPEKRLLSPKETSVPFPASQNPRERAQFTEQALSLVSAAFAKKDWSDVLQKTSSLLNPEAAHTLSSDIYHLRGMALFEVGETEAAVTTLETALALEQNTEKRLAFLMDYAHVLSTLGRWNETLACADEALQQVSDAPYWQALRQQASAQMAVRTGPSGSQSLLLAHQEIEVFFSYSHKDEALRHELEKYLSNLKRQRAIVGWYDGEIGAGNEWDREIDTHLNSAHVILLLVSQDFIASDYCYEKEMKRALKRHEAGEARVIPIILRPAHWEVTPFGKLHALPTGATPITSWPNRDEAFLDVARGIQKVVDRLIKSTPTIGEFL